MHRQLALTLFDRGRPPTEIASTETFRFVVEPFCPSCIKELLVRNSLIGLFKSLVCLFVGSGLLSPSMEAPMHALSRFRSRFCAYLVLVTCLVLVMPTTWSAAARPIDARDIASALAFDASTSQAPEVRSSAVLLTFTPLPDGAGRDGTVAQPLDLSLSRLTQALAMGMVHEVHPVPELGGVILEGASSDLLHEVATWPWTESVLPATSTTMQEVAPRVAARDAAMAHQRLGIAPTTPQLPDSETPTALNGLTNLTMHLDETYLTGSVTTVGVPMTLTLKRDATVKSQVNLTPSSNSFNIYFSQNMEAGDTVEVAIQGQSPISVPVAALSAAANKVANQIDATGPANRWVNVLLFSYKDWQWYYSSGNTNGSGNYLADFSAQTDMRLGDGIEIHYYNEQGYRTILRNQRVPGLSIDPTYRWVSGYTDVQGRELSLTLKNSAGAIKSSATLMARSGGFFSTQFQSQDACAAQVNIMVGDRVELRYGAQLITTVVVPDVRVTSINPSTDQVSGVAPAGSKLRLYGSDSYQATGTSQELTANGSGQFIANFTGSIDLVRGSYSGVTYFNAQDDQVYGTALYAAPHVKINTPGSYIYLAAAPNETLTATLRNNAGAIKATAQGSAAPTGSLFLYFSDSNGHSVSINPGDRVEVGFASGTQTVNTIGLSSLIDRDARKVTGTGPVNISLRLIYNYGSQSALLTTSNTGAFSHTFSGILSGGYSVEAIARNAAGNDVSLRSYVPQVTINADSNSLYGYGPANQSLLLTLKNSSGVTKASASATTAAYGYYYLYGELGDIMVGDRVVVDVAGLRYEQPIVALSVMGDPQTDIVSGTAPPNGWLNVFDDRYFGPYSAYYYKSFYADSAGIFSTDFGGADVRSGDTVRVLFWQNGNYDRVEAHRPLPYIYLNHTFNSISGATTPGATGTITVRSSANVIKASGNITVDNTWGTFYFAPRSLDLIPGDRVTVAISGLNRTVTVIPMSATVNLATDTVSGSSLSNSQLGVQAYQWRGSYYSTWTGDGSLSRFVNTDGSGGFSADFSCQVDLKQGDYSSLYYMDSQDNRFGASFYTTSPSLTLGGVQGAVLPGAPIAVPYSISGGVHLQSVWVRWDDESHASDGLYDNYAGGQQISAASGEYLFNAPNGGVVYFKLFASIDGRTLESDEQQVTVSNALAPAIVEPVSGTTNDTTPRISGVASPNVTVTLLKGANPIATTTSDAQGNFAFDISAPLSDGIHTFKVTVPSGSAANPASKVVMLTVDPTLLINPVGVVLTMRGQNQHLRDSQGYANLGGSIWSRPGDSVEVAVPITGNVISATLLVNGNAVAPLLSADGVVYHATFTPPPSGVYTVAAEIQQTSMARSTTSIVLFMGTVDTEGYVFDGNLGIEHRLLGATVTAYERVEGTDLWQPWNAALWGQLNPQNTPVDGYYAFYPPPGTYKVVVTYPGYTNHESAPITITQEPLHPNISLTKIHPLYLPLTMR